MPVGTFWRAFRRALAGVYNNGALGYAKGAAYSALLAFLPVLTSTTAILVQVNAEAVSRRVTTLFFRVAPPGVEDLVRFQVTQRGSRPTVLPVAAALLAIWAASGVMISLMEAFHDTYHVPDKRTRGPQAHHRHDPGGHHDPADRRQHRADGSRRPPRRTGSSTLSAFSHPARRWKAACGGSPSSFAQS